MGKYKYEKGKYYRKSSNGNWFEVERDNDGHLTWTQPDGQKVAEYQFKVPAINEPYIMLPRGEFEIPSFGVIDGGNGSIKRGISSYDEAKQIYNNAVERGAFSDPSENILNDLPFGILSGGASVVAKGANNLGELL